MKSAGPEGLGLGGIMREKFLKKLVKIVEESNIAELEVSRWGRKVRILKNSANSNHTIKPAPRQDESGQLVADDEAASEAVVLGAETKAPPVLGEMKNGQLIRSPMVGTFYRASTPGAEPYVDIGHQISPGKILCLIEAMKLMNEIEAEVSGTIQEILVENGNPVEYNQPLFKVAVD